MAGSASDGGAGIVLSVICRIPGTGYVKAISYRCRGLEKEAAD